MNKVPNNITLDTDNVKIKIDVNMTRFRVLQRASPRVYALY